MTILHNLPDPLLITNYVSWLSPHSPLSITRHDADPSICIKLSIALIPHLLGLLETVCWVDKWTGETEDVQRSIGVIEDLRRALIDGLDECMSCCPDDYQVNYNTYYQNQYIYQQYLKMLDDGDTAASFDAPENFDSDGSDTGDDVTARQYALCRLVKQYVATALYNQALAITYAASAAAALTRFLPFPAPIQGVISDAVQDMTTDALQGLLDDCAAIQDVACCMIDSLQGQPTTLAAIQTSLDDCGFDFGSNRSQIAAMVDRTNKNEDNARAFVAAMAQTMQQAQAGSGATAQDCDCTCCDADIVLEDYAGTGCEIEYVGNCLYKLTQATATHIGDATVYYFSFQDILSSCLLVENSPDPTRPTQGVGLDTSDIDCSGTHHDHYVGGFTGGNLRAAHWSQADPFNYIKITKVP